MGTWTHIFNFIESDRDFVPIPSNGVNFGNYISGSGWSTTDARSPQVYGAKHRQLLIGLSGLSNVHLTDVTFYYNLTKGCQVPNL